MTGPENMPGLPTKPEVARVRTLVQLAKDIVTERDAAKSAARTAMQHAIRCGELLIQAKSQCRHGDFEAWAATNTGMSKSMYTGYMRLANRRAELSDDMPIRDALKLLAEPKSSPARGPAVAASDIAMAREQIQAINNRLQEPEVQRVVPLPDPRADARQGEPKAEPDWLLAVRRLGLEARRAGHSEHNVLVAVTDGFEDFAPDEPDPEAEQEDAIAAGAEPDGQEDWPAWRGIRWTAAERRAADLLWPKIRNEIEQMLEQGKRNMVTISPSAVAHVAQRLRLFFDPSYHEVVRKRILSKLRVAPEHEAAEQQDDGISDAELRELVEAKKGRRSANATAKEIGVTPTTLTSFLNGGTPYGKTRTRLQAYVS
jgi:hypothetical protein